MGGYQAWGATFYEAYTFSVKTNFFNYDLVAIPL